MIYEVLISLFYDICLICCDICFKILESYKFAVEKYEVSIPEEMKCEMFIGSSNSNSRIVTAKVFKLYTQIYSGQGLFMVGIYVNYVLIYSYHCK